MSVNNLNNEVDENEEEEELDPRIQFELEKLNNSCVEINKLENGLEEAKSLFIKNKNLQTQRLGYLQKKLGVENINKAKPYYESLKVTEKLQYETQEAVHDFQITNSLYKTAVETLAVAEQNVEVKLSEEWQEHLSMTVKKITMSKEAADKAGKHHRNVAAQFQKAEQHSQYLEKEFKKAIHKTQSYYVEKKRWNVQMETQKSHIHELEQTLIHTKKVYKEAMVNLSNISEEIHNRRKLDKMIKESLPIKLEKPKLEHQNSETHSLSNESQTSETDNKKLKNFLTYYNLSLPNKNSVNNFADSNYPSSQEDSTTKTYDELKNCDNSEYISLGLNSTASNSRCSSPSNSMENDLEWNKTNITINNDDHLKVNNIESQADSKDFSSSSVSREQTELPNQFFNHLAKTPQLTSTDNLGLSSLTLKSKSKSTEQNHNRQISSSKKQQQVSKPVRNETPLLSNLLLQHSVRY